MNELYRKISRDYCIYINECTNDKYPKGSVFLIEINVLDFKKGELVLYENGDIQKYNNDNEKVIGRIIKIKKSNEL